MKTGRADDVQRVYRHETQGRFFDGDLGRPTSDSRPNFTGSFATAGDAGWFIRILSTYNPPEGGSSIDRGTVLSLGMHSAGLSTFTYFLLT